MAAELVTFQAGVSRETPAFSLLGWIVSVARGRLPEDKWRLGIFGHLLFQTASQMAESS